MLGLFCTALLCSPGAHAEDASAAETAAARSLAVDGLKLAQSGNCVDALPKLERAEKLYHSAVVASRLGECYVSVGRLVEGTEILRKVLREPAPAEPTPALTKALDRAQRALDSAKPRIAGLTIKATGAENVSVKIDGNVVAGALLDTEVPSDPGEHSIEATSPGYLKAAARITVGEGEKKTVSLTMTRDPNAPVATSAATPATATPDAPSPSSTRERPESDVSSSPPPPAQAPNRTGAYVALGLGAAGVAAGGVLGFMTIKQHRDLQGACPGGVCPPAQQDALDSAKQLGNFSTIAFGVGAAGLALGTILFVSAGSSSEDHAAGVPSKRFAGLSNLRAGVGAGRLDFGADF